MGLFVRCSLGFFLPCLRGTVSAQTVRCSCSACTFTMTVLSIMLLRVHSAAPTYIQSGGTILCFTLWPHLLDTVTCSTSWTVSWRYSEHYMVFVHGLLLCAVCCWTAVLLLDGGLAVGRRSAWLCCCRALLCRGTLLSRSALVFYGALLCFVKLCSPALLCSVTVLYSISIRICIAASCRTGV
jgi:hypothetical protein